MMFWQEHGRQIDLLFSDTLMPEVMTGFDLTKKVRDCLDRA